MAGSSKHSRRYPMLQRRHSDRQRDTQQIPDPERNRNLNRRHFVKTAVMIGAGAMVTTCLPFRAQGVENAKDSADSTENLLHAQKDESSLQPPVRIPEVSIRKRSPDSALVGVSNSEVIEIKLADVLKFHGYCAGGVAFSFRVAQEAFKALYGAGSASPSKPEGTNFNSLLPGGCFSLYHRGSNRLWGDPKPGGFSPPSGRDEKDCLHR